MLRRLLPITATLLAAAALATPAAAQPASEATLVGRALLAPDAAAPTASRRSRSPATAGRCIRSWKGRLSSDDPTTRRVYAFDIATRRYVERLPDYRVATADLLVRSSANSTTKLFGLTRDSAAVELGRCRVAASRIHLVVIFRVVRVGVIRLVGILVESAAHGCGAGLGSHSAEMG